MWLLTILKIKRIQFEISSSKDEQINFWWVCLAKPDIKHYIPVDLEPQELVLSAGEKLQWYYKIYRQTFEGSEIG